MNLVVDTNILFSYFWKNSVAKKIILMEKLILYSPIFALEELKKHKMEIIHKAKISPAEFNSIRSELAAMVQFIDINEYEDLLSDALGICPDSNDIDFFALALKKEIPLWSNDSTLKTQKKLLVLSTKDLISTPDFKEIFFG